MKTSKFLLRAVLPALLAFFLLLAGSIGPAAAAELSTVSVSAPASVSAVTVNSSSVCGSGTTGDNSNLLSVNRWSGSTTKFHSRIGGFDIGTLNAVVQRNMILSGGMSAGNGMWSTATSVSSFAVNLCLLDSLGGSVDGFVATLGGIVTGSWIISGLLVIMVFTLLYKGFTGAGPNAMKQLAGKVVIVALFVTMVGGATASTGGGKDGNVGPYQPGVMSPGWFAVTANNTISSIANVAPDIGIKLAGWSAPASPKAPGGDFTKCTPYLDAMKSEYSKQYNGMSSSSAMVPMILSQMWENTGLTAWKTAQFGSKSPAETESAYCHLLEMYSNSPVTNYDGGAPNPLHQRPLLMQISNLNADQINPSSKAFSTSDETMVDRSIIGWAACAANGGNPADESGWGVRAGFGEGAFSDGSKSITPKKCVDWWNNTEASLTDFDWSDNRSDIDKYTLMKDGRINEGTRSFLLNFHGNDNTAGQFSTGGYLVSAFFIMIVFGLLAIAAIGAKFGVLMYIPVFTFLLLKFLLPGVDNSGIMKHVRTFIGLVIGTVVINFVFALVAGISLILSKAVPQDGSVWSMIWTGLAPAIAIFVIMAAAKQTGLPNPFSVTGLTAYGNSMAGAGGGAMGNMNGLVNTRANGLARAAKNAGNRTMRRMMPSKFRMGATAAASAGAGAALGAGVANHHGAVAAKGARKDANGVITNARGRRQGMSSKAASAFKGMDASAVDGVVGEASSAGALHIAAPAVAPTAAAGSFLSAVPNSQMGRMGGTVAERHQNASAARAERSAAKDYNKVIKMTEAGYGEKVRDAVSGEKAVLGGIAAAYTRKPGIKSAANLAAGAVVSGARISGAAVPALKTAWQAGATEFKNKPFKTSAKVLGGAALVATSLPLAVGVGAIAATRATGSYAARNLNHNARLGRADQMTDQYRAARIEEVTKYKSAKDTEAAAQRQAEKAERQSRRAAPRTQSVPQTLPKTTKEKLGDMISRGSQGTTDYFGGPALA